MLLEGASRWRWRWRITPFHDAGRRCLLPRGTWGISEKNPPTSLFPPLSPKEKPWQIEFEDALVTERGCWKSKRGSRIGHNGSHWWGLPRGTPRIYGNRKVSRHLTKPEWRWRDGGNDNSQESIQIEREESHRILLLLLLPLFLFLPWSFLEIPAMVARNAAKNPRWGQWLRRRVVAGYARRIMPSIPEHRNHFVNAG